MYQLEQNHKLHKIWLYCNQIEKYEDNLTAREAKILRQIKELTQIGKPCHAKSQPFAKIQKRDSAQNMLFMITKHTMGSPLPPHLKTQQSKTVSPSLWKTLKAKLTTLMSKSE
jgi:hypothetical protein